MLSYVFHVLIRGFVLFILLYTVIASALSLLQMVAALFIVPRHIAKTRAYEYKLMGASANMPPISVLTPAYNEEATVVDTVKSMLGSNYSNYEIVVINDGSTDNTLGALVGAFNLRKILYPVRERLATKKVKAIYYNPDIPRLRLIDKENGGKSDALNAGINLARYPYFASLDADSILGEDALFRIAMAFMQDKRAVALGGTLRVANGCSIKDGKILRPGIPKNVWALFQTIEYFRSFLAGRIGWSGFNSLLVISGAFGAFQKEAALQVGGYTAETVGEDMDLVMKLHRFMRDRKIEYRVSFLPDPVCWTQAPESLDVLFRQRRRWQVGLIDVLGRYRKMFFNPKYGLVGLVGMPYYFLFEMASPVVELLGYILVPAAWAFGLVSLDALILFFTAVFLFGMATSIGSLVVEDLANTKIRLREAPLLGLLCIAENLFYRQLTVFFRFAGILGFRKYKNSWGEMRRQKFH